MPELQIMPSDFERINPGKNARKIPTELIRPMPRTDIKKSVDKIPNFDMAEELPEKELSSKSKQERLVEARIQQSVWTILRDYEKRELKRKPNDDFSKIEEKLYELLYDKFREYIKLKMFDKQDFKNFQDPRYLSINGLLSFRNSSMGVEMTIEEKAKYVSNLWEDGFCKLINIQKPHPSSTTDSLFEKLAENILKPIIHDEIGGPYKGKISDEQVEEEFRNLLQGEKDKEKIDRFIERKNYERRTRMGNQLPGKKEKVEKTNESAADFALDEALANKVSRDLEILKKYPYGAEERQRSINDIAVCFSLYQLNHEKDGDDEEGQFNQFCQICGIVEEDDKKEVLERIGQLDELNKK